MTNWVERYQEQIDELEGDISDLKDNIEQSEEDIKELKERISDAKDESEQEQRYRYYRKYFFPMFEHARKFGFSIKDARNAAAEACWYGANIKDDGTIEHGVAISFRMIKHIPFLEHLGEKKTTKFYQWLVKMSKDIITPSDKSFQWDNEEDSDYRYIVLYLFTNNNNYHYDKKTNTIIKDDSKNKTSQKNGARRMFRKCFPKLINEWEKDFRKENSHYSQIPKYLIRERKENMRKSRKKKKAASAYDSESDSESEDEELENELQERIEELESEKKELQKTLDEMYDEEKELKSKAERWEDDEMFTKPIDEYGITCYTMARQLRMSPKMASELAFAFAHPFVVGNIENSDEFRTYLRKLLHPQFIIAEHMNKSPPLGKMLMWSVKYAKSLAGSSTKKKKAIIDDIRWIVGTRRSSGLTDRDIPKSEYRLYVKAFTRYFPKVVKEVRSRQKQRTKKEVK